MIQTEYRIHRDGTAFATTDSARVAEAWSRIGMTVTAETTDKPLVREVHL